MLISVPLTVSDGVGDRIFDWFRQVPGEVAGLYIEPAATAQSMSQLKSAHLIQKNKSLRHSLQSSETVALVNPDTDGPTDGPIVVTVSVMHDSKHSEAEVEKRVKILLATASVAGFTAAIMRGEI
jgi:hypothetical protein